MRQRRTVGLHQIEQLEPRCLLSAEPWITELMASNADTLKDAEGTSPDWIELFNAGDETWDVNGWSLTDDPDRLRKWTFPNLSVAAGDYLTVFASGQVFPDKMDAGGHLHASFRLSSKGEYLALVDPLGAIRQQFRPSFPVQQTDTSYGYSAGSRTSVLVEAGSVAAVYLPTDAPPPADWAEPDFEVDPSWITDATDDSAIRMPVGYDNGQPAPGLVAHWSLDAATDLVVPDTLGQHEGVLFGNGEIVSEGVVGGSLELPSSGGMHVAYDAGLNSTSFTFSTWVRATTTNGFGAVITNRYDSGSGDLRGFILYNDSNGRWAFWTGDGSAPWDTLVGPSVEVDRWTHLAIRYDAATHTKSLFVDGQVAAESQVPGYRPNPQREMHLGAGEDFGTNYYFRGNIDDAALFDRALTSDDIAGMMRSSILDGASGKYRGIFQSELTEMPHTSSSAYIRIPFRVTDASDIDQLWLDLRYDDGAVVYLNGTEVARTNVIGDPPSFDATATTPHDDTGDFTRWNISSARSSLREGQNVLAIHGVNQSLTDEDFLVWPQLVAVEHYVNANQPGYLPNATPGQGNDAVFAALTTATVSASEPDQAFTGSLRIRLASDLSTAPIYYTLDGSEPSSDSPRYTGTLTIDRSTQLRVRHPARSDSRTLDNSKLHATLRRNRAAGCPVAHSGDRQF